MGICGRMLQGLRWRLFKVDNLKGCFCILILPYTVNHRKTSAIMKPNVCINLKAQKNLGITSSNYESLSWSVELEYFASYNSSLLCSAKMLSLVTTAVKWKLIQYLSRSRCWCSFILVAESQFTAPIKPLLALSLFSATPQF